MTKKWTDQEIEELIQILETEGIVTRKNNSSLGSRIRRNIQSVFEDKGYTDFVYIEEALDNYIDYSGAVYNINYFTDREAREYMRKYILKSY